VSRQDAGAALAVESWHWGRTGARYLSFANPHANVLKNVAAYVTRACVFTASKRSLCSSPKLAINAMSDDEVVDPKLSASAKCLATESCAKLLVGGGARIDITVIQALQSHTHFPPSG